MESLLSIYIEFVAKILRRLHVTVGISGISVGFQEEAQQSLDQRVAKLDAARANLVDGIQAIDQLMAEAQKNKTEIAEAAQQISRLKADKQTLAEELSAIKSVVTADVDAFRKIAGVPTVGDIRRERLIGFASGITASLIASALIYGTTKFFQSFGA
ncbi:hypothetical protein CDR19_16610 [Ectopseudomonas toyotomiensis]|uniref:hypothetical protein n=1 Tax=Ectopseudomonas toyotomiensis TaxID=554344 RepID=UPI000943C273|nr:hypothetical protein [Pseudomonas toyotomiensis]PIA70324.1 hypothetical protein CDR19_16610 [Pseudomonas toyotomiensis]